MDREHIQPSIQNNTNTSFSQSHNRAFPTITEAPIQHSKRQPRNEFRATWSRNFLSIVTSSTPSQSPAQVCNVTLTIHSPTTSEIDTDFRGGVGRTYNLYAHPSIRTLHRLSETVKQLLSLVPPSLLPFSPFHPLFQVIVNLY
jgi:hypothetical protein